jgi:aminoglycoside phosphotransferase (APT) family kinase protein
VTSPPLEQPPQQALDWCLRVTGGVGPCRVTRLRGGLAASTHLVETGVGSPSAPAVVLRRFVGERTPIWPPIAQEVAALAAIAECALPYQTPRVLGFDLDGSACGHPAIVLTFVPGQLNLSPTHSLARAGELGKALAQLHQAQARVPSELRPFELKLTQPAPDGTVIDWASVRRVLGGLHAAGNELIHGDFHMGNALFENSNLSALLDFTCVRRGPWQFDVGYCRCDLSLLFGLAEADEFSSAYQETRGLRVTALPVWDLAGAIKAHPDASAWLPGWVDAGRTDLEPGLIRERLARFVEQALRGARAATGGH